MEDKSQRINQKIPGRKTGWDADPDHRVNMEQEGLLFGKTKGRKKPRHHPKNIMGSRKGWCYLCGKQGPTEEHHIFGGPNRRLSEEYGLKVDLCRECHQTGAAAVHRNKETMQMLHELGQQAFENQIGSRNGFMKIFGRNYIDE